MKLALAPGGAKKMPMLLRYLFALFLALSAPAAEHPHVVLITVDGLGWGDLSASGNAQVPTPRMDRLLSESAVFRDFHTSPLDAPTRAALLTGLEPARAGVWGTHSGRNRLRPGLPTIASLLKNAGYATGLFGTWALGDTAPCRPQDHGYDFVLTHPGSLPGNAADFFSNDGSDDLWLLNGEPTSRSGSWSDAIFGAAATFLEKAASQPVFCHLSPSLPAGMPAQKMESFRDRPDVPSPLRAAWIAELDSRIGDLLDHLEMAGLSAKTIVILTSTSGMHDPGGKPAFNAGRRGHRGSPLEGGHCVPLVIRWSAGGPPANISAPAAHYDLLPTLAALTGVSLPADCKPDGISLAPVLENSAAAPAPAGRILITDAQEVPVPVPWRRQCVMSGPWRLINGRELYDLRSDPGQRKNIANTNAETVQRLRASAESWWQNLSTDKLECIRTTIGGVQDPVLLTPHDWMARGGSAVSRQDVMAGTPANGQWLLHVASEGHYDILLRRWPLTVNRALSDSFFTPDKARLRIGPQDETRPVLPGATGINFRITLKPGPAVLQTWFTGAGKTSGAFFVEIRRAVEIRAARPVPEPR
jgi:arylsulfatase A-like enzyme